MIPKITRGGSSFKGAFQYYMHDKDADTRERVAWAQTENMRTEDPDKAWKVMAYTAREQDRLKEASGQSRAGRKLEKPVFAFSLAWHPEQNPDKEHMLETARSAIQMLGLSEHEAIIIEHKDEPQKHVHVVINRVHPITGLAGDVRNSKRKFSDFAREYEREHGKIYCTQREDNHERRENGESTRYHEPVISDAWNAAAGGYDFAKALEAKGYVLAQGRKRIVVIDPHGKAHNPVRHLEGVKNKEFLAGLDDLDLSKLPNANVITAKRKSLEVDPVPDDRQDAFEVLASMRINTLHEKHMNEADRLRLQFSRRMDKSKKKLASHYHLPEKKSEIKELGEQLKHPPWWKKLFGITRKERQHLGRLILGFKDARDRYREKIDHIASQREEALSELRERQEAENVQLKVQIEAQRSAGNYTPQRKRGRKSKERKRPDHKKTRDR